MKLSQEVEKRLLSLNYDEAEIEKVISHYKKYDEKPFTNSFIQETGNNINDVHYSLSNIGFEDEEIKKLASSYPQIFTVKMDAVRENVGFMTALGYDSEALKKIITQSPVVLFNKDTSLEGKKKIDDIYQSAMASEEDNKKPGKSI